MHIPRILIFGLFSSVFSTPLFPRSSSKYRNVIKAMHEIRNEMNLLNVHIQAVRCGDPNSLVRLAGSAENAKHALEEAKSQISCIKRIGIFGSLKMRGASRKINKSVNRAMNSLISKKETMCEMGVAPLILQALRSQQSASSDLSNMVATKLPKIITRIMRKKMSHSSRSLNRAINTYSEGCRSCPSCNGASGNLIEPCGAEPSCCRVPSQFRTAQTLSAFVGQSFPDSSPNLDPNIQPVDNLQPPEDVEDIELQSPELEAKIDEEAMAIDAEPDQPASHFLKRHLWSTPFLFI